VTHTLDHFLDGLGPGQHHRASVPVDQVPVAVKRSDCPGWRLFARPVKIPAGAGLSKTRSPSH
jgi:hypothetical protein